VVNLNDVEHSKIEALLEIDDAGTADRDARARVRRRVSRANLALNARRWHAFYARMARQVRTIVVCSDVDRERLSEPNARVVPNIYPTPERPLGRLSAGSPPTVSIIGQLHYPPNADAAAFFVRDVLPKLRAEIPDVEVRLVGEPSASVAALADVQGVTVTGLVPDIAAELARTDVCAVPIRFGGGTRIKILEAFAHRIPVVATTIGAEGLDVENGQQLLLADDASSFAAACASLLRDDALRSQVTASANAHWHERFTEAAFQQAVAGVVDAIALRPQAS
jgi:glycosyltransferase involved in cell wall biosynthesis